MIADKLYRELLNLRNISSPPMGRRPMKIGLRPITFAIAILSAYLSERPDYNAHPVQYQQSWFEIVFVNPFLVLSIFMDEKSDMIKEAYGSVI